MARSEGTGPRGHFYKRVQSPVGRLTLVATDEGLAAILWENDPPGRVRLDIDKEDTSHPVLVEAERQLEEYFAGRRQHFTLKLDPSGTAFQRTVWGALMTIPFGETRSYGQIATQIGHPRRRARRWCGQRQKSPVDRRAVPPRRRRHGRTHGIRGRARCEGAPAGIREGRKGSGSKDPTPLMNSRRTWRRVFRPAPS